MSSDNVGYYEPCEWDECLADNVGETIKLYIGVGEGDLLFEDVVLTSNNNDDKYTITSINSNENTEFTADEISDIVDVFGALVLVL